MKNLDLHLKNKILCNLKVLITQQKNKFYYNIRHNFKIFQQKQCQEISSKIKLF